MKKSQAKFFIGLDVGGTKLAAALVNKTGKILCRVKNITPPKAKPKVILKAIREVLMQLLTEAQIPKDDLAGIGIGIPGLVDSQGKQILRTPNINLSNFPLAAAIKKTFRVPVILGNDVNAGVLAEQWLGAGQGHQNIVGIFVGTGVGGGVICNGKLFTGSHGLAGEIGHIIIDPTGPKCSCGNHGCLEALAARLAVEREIRLRIKRGEKTSLLEITNGRLEAIKSKTLKKALNKKDPLVTKVMTEAAITLGRACVSLRHIFNPSLIILGGGVIEACGDFILPIVHKAVDGDPFFARIDNCKIVNAKLADDAGVLGAAALIKNYLQDVKSRKS